MTKIFGAAVLASLLTGCALPPQSSAVRLAEEEQDCAPPLGSHIKVPDCGYSSSFDHNASALMGSMRVSFGPSRF
jgi:hypothetical protein